MDTIETIEDQAAFFQKAYHRYLEAKASSGEIDYYYRICDTIVGLSFAGKALVSHITPALDHLRVSPTNPDLTICLWDSTSTNTRMDPPPWKPDRYTYRGDIWGYNSSRIKTAFHWHEFSLNMMDFEAKTGLYWVERAEGLPSWFNAAPLRTLLHWWLHNNECQLVHAAAVGTESGAVLITGKGGIGKSTTALSCLKAGLFYLGDDYVIVRLRPEPFVYSLYNTAKLNADHFNNFPELTKFISNAGTLKDEKAVLFLHPAFNGQIINAMPLKAVIVPHITDNNKSQLLRTSPENILRAAAFTTMTQLPGAGIKTYEFFNQLSVSLPCFSIELGRDIAQIPAAISDFLSGISREGADGSFHEHHAAARPQATLKIWPLVSIIIPVFNGEPFIREAVENILSQGYPSLEIVIVDDGSTDRTKDIVEQMSHEIRYFRQDNGGPAAARNRGIREATGEFIAFNDVDDLWPKNNLPMLANELLQNQEIEVVHGHAQLAHYNPAAGEYEYRGNPAESFPYSIGAALYRRSAFTKVGLFDPTLLYGEDTDWFSRAQELNLPIRRLEAVTLIVRRHGSNMTCNKTSVELNSLRVFKKSLDRMRARKEDSQALP